MIAGKKDDALGKPRYSMTINYQELDAITISPEYPLPTIQEILDMLHGARVFTTAWSKDSIKYEPSPKIGIKPPSLRTRANMSLR